MRLCSPVSHNPFASMLKRKRDISAIGSPSYQIEEKSRSSSSSSITEDSIETARSEASSPEYHDSHSPINNMQRTKSFSIQPVKLPNSFINPIKRRKIESSEDSDIKIITGSTITSSTTVSQSNMSEMRNQSILYSEKKYNKPESIIKQINPPPQSAPPPPPPLSSSTAIGYSNDSPMLPVLFSSRKNIVNKREPFREIEKHENNKNVKIVNDKEYIVKREVGKGGSGHVYEVISSNSNNEVLALKVISTYTEEDRKCIKSEIEYLEKFRGNEYIIQLIDSQMTEKETFIVMEFGNLSLKEFLKKNKNELEIPQIIDLFLQLLYCVSQIHNANIIHADLKPANFLFVNNRLKLIDFGISKQIEDPSNTTKVIDVNAKGTINYVPPEVLEQDCDSDYYGNENGGGNSCGGKKFGRSRDIYSLGCIFYEMIYNITPIQRFSPLSIDVLRKFKDPIAIYPKDGPVVPERVKHVINKCLRKNPNERPKIDELIQYTKQLLEPPKTKAEDINLILKYISEKIDLKDESTRMIISKILADIINEGEPLNIHTIYKKVLKK